MIELDPGTVQAIILIVIGIIILQGIWLAYLSFMMWKKHRAEKKAELKKEQAEEKGVPEEKELPKE